jgi:hypothetical protein
MSGLGRELKKQLFHEIFQFHIALKNLDTKISFLQIYSSKIIFECIFK